MRLNRILELWNLVNMVLRSGDGGRYTLCSARTAPLPLTKGEMLAVIKKYSLWAYLAVRAARFT